MSSFVALQPPPGPALKNYSTTHRPSEQPAQNLPPTFIDAMTVREEVYVEEQHIPLELEFDSEDAQSFHWVVYASVGGASGERRGSAGLPVGTIRVVPPPHVHWEGPVMEGGREEEGCLRRPGEAYVRKGRLAVLKPYRSEFLFCSQRSLLTSAELGLSGLLVKAALEHLSNHADEVVPPASPAEMELKRIETGTDTEGGAWDGLVLVHAQSAIEKLWRSWGFVRDQNMGEWDEEGIMHVGMWRRITVNRRRPSLISSSSGQGMA